MDRRQAFRRRFFAAFVGVLAACAAPAVTLTILHTSDLHGHVDPHDELADKDFGEGLARIAHAVRTIRAEGRPTLLLDSGDTIQGTPAQALTLRGGGGQASDPTIRAMNAIGYDAMAVGNHEFDFGLSRLEKSHGEAKFPWLSANILREKGEPAFPPYAIRQVAGIRVGILGLTTKSVPFWESPDNIRGLRFEDTVATARRYVALLRAQEQCDLVIVLTHEGFERDPSTGQDRGGSEENRAYALATEVSGIDLLLTGHTHSDVAPRKLGGAWISQPGRFGNTLTRFDVDLEKKGGKWAVSNIAGRNLPMKEVTADPEIAAAVAAEHSAAMAALSETVATLSAPVDASQARVADTAIIDWVHSVQLREGQADLSFASLLPGMLPEWPAGPLTVRQVWSLYPYENSLVTVTATGRQVREALEVAARCVSGVSAQDGRAAWIRNARVWGYNCDTAEGIEYALDPTRPEGHRVLFLRRRGKPVKDEETFSVALNSYRAAGGGGYAIWRQCPRVSTKDLGLRELLLDDARKRTVLRLDANQNWFLSPGLPEGRFSGN
jgi:2',3'-cyclic-nucleotide 2'-phosphodiesterase (5'-nucleotidase family)